MRAKLLMCFCTKNCVGTQCEDLSTFCFWQRLTIISMNIGNKRENGNTFLYHMCKKLIF